jgi:hypothetical protein
MHRIFLALHLAVGGVWTRADILNLSNGDRYVGDIELVNTREVHLKSEVVGILKVPREKVASIFFGTNQPSIKVTATAPAPSAFDEKSIEQVQKEFLSTANPEANQMFTDLVQGLASGKISVNDIRKQASDTLKELRELQAEGGEDDDNAILSSYVSILEKFIKEGSTNRTRAIPPKPAPAPRRPKPADEE